jgi:hypothetical protein
MWNGIPERHGAPADLVLGQRSFTARDENAGGGPDAVGMRWPHAIAVWCGEVMVADAGDNRIMGWRSLPGASGQSCDYVLGQAMHRIDHNRAATRQRGVEHAVRARGNGRSARQSPTPRARLVRFGPA